jgi:hypothetical protein
LASLLGCLQAQTAAAPPDFLKAAIVVAKEVLFQERGLAVQPLAASSLYNVIKFILYRTKQFDLIKVSPLALNLFVVRLPDLGVK